MVGAAVILPTVSSWNAGELHDESMFDAVSYALKFLLDPPEVEVIQTTTQSIPTGFVSGTPLTFQSAVKDNDGAWNASTPTFVTVQTPGWYEAEWATAWATLADTTVRISGLYLNGNFLNAAMLGYGDFINNTTTVPEVWMSYDLFLNTGDQVSLGLMQGSAGALSTSSSLVSDQRTFMRLRWASL